MESNYQIKFVDGLTDWLEFDFKQKEVRLKAAVKQLREDLRSLILDEAIRVGEEYKELKKLPSNKKELLDLKQKAKAQAREVSINRYGRKLRDEAFAQLDRLSTRD